MPSTARECSGLEESAGIEQVTGRGCVAHWLKDKEEGGGSGMDVRVHLRNGVL
jgi:hypothetical protein